MDLLSLLFAILSTTVHHGFFTVFSVVALCCWLCLLMLLFFRTPSLGSATYPPLLLPLLLSSLSALALFFSDGLYQSELAKTQLFFCVLFFWPLITTYCLPVPSLRVNRYRFITLIFAAALLRLFIIHTSPAPPIDVYTLLHEAPMLVLWGHNPYTAVFSPVYAGIVSDYYPYWPVSFLIQIPFFWLFHDPRVLLAAADIIGALFVYLIGKKTLAAQQWAVLFLFRPNAYFVIEQSWLAPLEVCFFLAAWYFLTQKRAVMCGLFLALLIGTKQHYLLILPFLLLSVPFWRTILFTCLTTLSMVVLPFVTWNVTAFYSDTVGFLARDPARITNAPLADSLTLNAAWLSHTGTFLPRLPLLILTALLWVSIAYRLWRTRHTQTLTLPLRLAAVVLFLLGLYLLGYYSFINFYYSLSGLYLAFFATRFQTRDKKLYQ